MNRQLHAKPGTGHLGFDDRLEHRVSGLAFYANPDKDLAYFYMPLRVIPQLQTDGKPMVNLFAFEDGGYLSFNAQWRASDQQLAALRVHLAGLLELELENQLQLTFAPVSHVHLSLFLNQNDSEPVLLGESSSSGAPPYSSLFNLKLDKKQFETVTQTLAGQAGLISIQLDSSWTDTLEVKGQLQGELNFESMRQLDRADRDVLAVFVKEQIELGNLNIQIETSLASDTPDYQTMTEKMIIQAVDVLQAMEADVEPGKRVFALQVEYINQIPLAQPLSIVTDLADWFESPGLRGQRINSSVTD